MSELTEKWLRPYVEGIPMTRLGLELEDVVPGRSTGMVDVIGAEIFDGDTVADLGEAKVATVRLGRWRGKPWWYTVTDDGSISGLPPYVARDKKFGVRKI